MRRRAAIVFGLLAAVVVAVLVLQPSRPPPRSGLATFNQVRVGMTLEEMIATVGKPTTPRWSD
jgi:urea transporter